MISMPARSCMPMAKRTASSMRRCQAGSGFSRREPALKRSFTYCGLGKLPTTVVGKGGKGRAMDFSFVNEGKENLLNFKVFSHELPNALAPAKCCLGLSLGCPFSRVAWFDSKPAQEFAAPSKATQRIVMWIKQVKYL